MYTNMRTQPSICHIGKLSMSLVARRMVLTPPFSMEASTISKNPFGAGVHLKKASRDSELQKMLSLLSRCQVIHVGRIALFGIGIDAYAVGNICRTNM